MRLNKIAIVWNEKLRLWKLKAEFEGVKIDGELRIISGKKSQRGNLRKCAIFTLFSSKFIIFSHFPSIF